MGCISTFVQYKNALAIESRTRSDMFFILKTNNKIIEQKSEHIGNW
jgi:hypothetical protein